jgi:hypothetical protein
MDRLPLISFVFLVADLFQPINGFAIKLFLNRNVGHGRRWRRAVPMLLARRKPDHIAGPDFFNRPAPALRATATRGHNQRLPQRMGMPGRPGAGLERNARADRAGRGV